MQAYLSQAFTLPQFETDLRDSQILFHVAEVEGNLIAYSKLVEPPCAGMYNRRGRNRD
jgi:hypothetical protein